MPHVERGQAVAMSWASSGNVGQQWQDGHPASRAQLHRDRQRKEQAVQQQSTGGNFDWKQQPIGGRPGVAVCAPAATGSPAVTFPGTGGQPDIFKPSKATISGGSVAATQNHVGQVVFGKGGQVSIEDSVPLDVPRQFVGAAGVANGRTAPRDEPVGARMKPRPANFENVAGVQTGEMQYHNTAHFDGGPKGRRTVDDRPASDKLFATKVMQGAVVMTQQEQQQLW